jgi:hypothetical protein
MTRLALLTAIGAVSFAAPAAAEPYPDDCDLVRIGKDGRETREMARRSPQSEDRGKSSGAASASSSSSSSHSSVSVSSHTGGRGQSRSSAVSSATDENGRTVTMRRDETGCTVTIDERGTTGE